MFEHCVPVGRLNGITAELGTLIGPDTTGRWFVVIGVDERGVTVGFATAADMRDASTVDGPRSVAERQNFPADKTVERPPNG